MKAKIRLSQNAMEVEVISHLTILWNPLLALIGHAIQQVILILLNVLYADDSLNHPIHAFIHLTIACYQIAT